MAQTIDPDEILNGLQSSEDDSNINHPTVKLLFVVFYLFFGAILSFSRDSFSSTGIAFFWFSIWFVLALRGLDFRKEKRMSSAIRAAFKLLVGVVPLVPFLRHLIDFVDAIPVLNFLGDFVGPEDVVCALFYFGAFVCLSKIYFMDINWLSLKLPGFLRGLVIRIFITYFVVRRYFVSLFSESIFAAKFKSKVVRGKPGLRLWLNKRTAFIATLGRQIITKATEIVSVTNTQMSERKVLEANQYEKESQLAFTLEDVLSTCLLVITAACLIFLPQLINTLISVNIP